MFELEYSKNGLIYFVETRFFQVKITKAERDVYAAIIDDKVAMKIGPGYYEPPSGPQKWSLAVDGKEYRVWEAL